ncbi:MAG: two-component system, OmpR family, response regulator QseB [Thermoanaerobaculia bacterium]|jgi:CheY-like chemotaxis protein|nr:two-component system, OmpR family, response regulator QseB [Thermoanaerobaculia bacterium]
MCPKALIVEDEPAARNLLAQLMEGLGFEVDLAADGEVAMSLLSAHDYELILLDIVLPKVSGIEVMESLKGDRAHLLGRIIVVTGLNILEIRSLFPTVHETLSKPVFPSRLREAVRSCVAPRAAAR